MVKLVPISGRRLCKILEKLGFETTEFHQSVIGGMSSARKPPIIGGIPSIKNHWMWSWWNHATYLWWVVFDKIHQVGSHARYKHPDGKKTVVPVHGDEELGKGILGEILKQIKLSRDEYDKLRRKV